MTDSEGRLDSMTAKFLTGVVPAGDAGARIG